MIGKMVTRIKVWSTTGPPMGCNYLWLREGSGLKYLKLRLKRSSGQEALDNVGSVEAVHAVTAEDSSLLAHCFFFWVHHEVTAHRDKVRIFLQSAHLHMSAEQQEWPVFILCLSNSIHQDLEPVPSHVAALFVKVKSNVTVDREDTERCEGSTARGEVFILWLDSHSLLHCGHK